MMRWSVTATLVGAQVVFGVVIIWLNWFGGFPDAAFKFFWRTIIEHLSTLQLTLLLLPSAVLVIRRDIRRTKEWKYWVLLFVLVLIFALGEAWNLHVMLTDVIRIVWQLYDIRFQRIDDGITALFVIIAFFVMYRLRAYFRFDRRPFYGCLGLIVAVACDSLFHFAYPVAFFIDPEHPAMPYILRTGGIIEECAESIAATLFLTYLIDLAFGPPAHRLNQAMAQPMAASRQPS